MDHLSAERRLATIELISDIAPIPDADAIERARIRGWDVVVKKGEFAVGDRVVYMEIDSFLPVADPRYAFLAPRGVRTQDEVEGHVLRTARLRGVYSQGIAFPYADFPELAGTAPGDDVTEALGITKWDPPLPANLAGQVRGHFPSQFRKTDEERIQNIPDILEADGSWVPTEKLDGTSMTVAVIDGEPHIAGRNYDLQDVPGNTMWATARAHGLFECILDSFPGKNVAVQGELFGPGIQGNPLKLHGVEFRIFTVQVGEPGASARALPRVEWPEWAYEMSVPVHNLTFPTSLEEALAQADGRPSLIPGAKGNIEGIVWRRSNSELLDDGTRASFKCLSQKYLLKHDR